MTESRKGGKFIDKDLKHLQIMCSQAHAYHWKEIGGTLAPLRATCPCVTRGDTPVVRPISVHYTE